MPSHRWTPHSSSHRLPSLPFDLLCQRHPRHRPRRLSTRAAARRGARPWKQPLCQRIPTSEPCARLPCPHPRRQHALEHQLYSHRRLHARRDWHHALDARARSQASQNLLVESLDTRSLLRPLEKQGDLGPDSLARLYAPVQAWRQHGHGPIDALLHGSGLQQNRHWHGGQSGLSMVFYRRRNHRRNRHAAHRHQQKPLGLWGDSTPHHPRLCRSL